MKLKQYIKANWPILIGILGSTSIVNIVFAIYIGEAITRVDLLYVNGLCLLILLGALGYHYNQIAKSYRMILNRMQNKEDLLEDVTADKQIFDMSLIREIERYKAQQFEEKEAEYKERLTNITEYTNQIVHDLKVNLSVCEMVTQRIPFEEQEKLNYVIEQMKFRVEQMLYVARANHYSEDIKVEYFEVKEILKKAIKDNAEFFMNKGIGICVEIEPYEILNDKKWVLYIFTQIMNNCSKYTSLGGQVDITSKEDSKAYYIHIQDNGIGIAKEEIGRIFDKGFTGSNGRFNTKATGMGLYYAKQMANALNIGIQVESEQGKYTKFTLAFYKHSDYMKLQEEFI